MKKRKITEIIIHCSATPKGVDVTVDEIDYWHRLRGYAGIGYHFVIYRDGSIRMGRPIEKIGAHCRNHNAQSIGICYVGGLTADGKFPLDTRTPQQRTSLQRLVRELQQVYPQSTVHGHNEFANKACPCFSVPDEL